MGSKEKKDETKRVKNVNLHKKKAQKAGKGSKVKFKDKHPKAATGIKIGLVVLMLLIIIGVGVLVGTFFGIFGDELKISEEDLVIKFENSTVYDKEGNEIAILSGGTKRKIVSMNEVNEYLPKAFVAIEDERFYTHRGVDIKRTLAATATFITHAGNSSFGGSTITQQLVKNITTDDEDSGLGGVLRKVKEMAKAIQVEQYLSKDQILELYLNIIFMGGDDINGVALGSIYYFDKDVKELSIAECAYLAGINHSPNAYKPFKEDIQLTPLHWMISYEDETIVLEQTKEGLKIYHNPIGVLTNNPEFSFHLTNINNYINLTPDVPQNRFSDEISLKIYGKGMGAIGLPGDNSSTSRFIRAAFNKTNSVCDEDEESSVSQFFHILDSVAVVRGTNVNANSIYDVTTYYCCINTTKGIYYYKTYTNNQITAIKMNESNMNSEMLNIYELVEKQQINYIN